ncbi:MULTISPECIES: ATP-binding protein [unclassified Meiothermus]|uniref:ATP-binding protein n=1 Tax=unclassified Meiothermus TaxID=370471 RepID=UPI000D7C7F04|nr:MULTISPECIES: ATP-binding protein [unclassified Meiothermus]PZA08670.1 histidine kinase [Meiothermus sp. Pnk-1]RYM40711.1 GAF domain-containing protein [Meiothermus sp. PNK-Is4]
MGYEEAGLLPPTYLGGPVITPDNCDREPIHIPGSIQPHGALLAVDAHTQLILQTSVNTAAHLGQPPESLRGSSLATVLSEAALQPMLAALPVGSPDNLQYRTTLDLPVGRRALTAHRVQDLLILEFEASQGYDPTGPHALRNAVFALEGAPTLDGLVQVAAQVVREISGFDRVMIYRFAPDASGEVIAEARRADLFSFLGHRFPESDIPAQARALYLRHLLRMTANVEAQPVPLEPLLNPQNGQPTPLGGAVLRATSPMHIQYLRNMGVASSLSVSIVVEGRLWGLISCHHLTPYVVPPEIRTALEYLGRLLSLQVQIKSRADTDAFRARLHAQHARLVEAVAHSLDPLETLSDERLDLAGLMRASGVIVFFEGRWRARGQTPSPTEIENLLAWLRTQEGSFLYTDALAELWPPAAQLSDRASGLLAIGVGNNWAEGVVWLRPEIATVARWGGATPQSAKDSLGPRRSFATYVETVRGRSEPWHPGELEEAQDLQRALTATLGERLHVLRALNAALERSNAEWQRLAFVIAHDMQEPVRLIAQFAELFALRYRQQLDGQAERILHFLLDETARLRTLTQDLYAYTALLSAPPLTRRPVALDEVLRDVLAKLEPQIRETQARLRLPEQAPLLQADPERLRDLLLHLLRNALTFGGRPPRIEVELERVPGAWQLTVRDHGPGIPPEYHEQVFGLFQRLGRREDAPGNGIGLALCRKIAEQHGGRLTLQSTPGAGCAFTFFLPDPEHHG